MWGKRINLWKKKMNKSKIPQIIYMIEIVIVILIDISVAFFWHVHSLEIFFIWINYAVIFFAKFTNINRPRKFYLCILHNLAFRNKQYAYLRLFSRKVEEVRLYYAQKMHLTCQLRNAVSCGCAFLQTFWLTAEFCHTTIICSFALCSE